MTAARLSVWFCLRTWRIAKGRLRCRPQDVRDKDGRAGKAGAASEAASQAAPQPCVRLK